VNNNKPPADRQDYRVPFLLLSIADHSRCFTTCPTATTTIAYSDHFQSTIILAVTCKRWGCRYCGQKKAVELGFRVELAKPNKLITLTVNPSTHSSPREAFNATRRELAELAKVIRREVKEFEYVRILEITKKGWPHYHLVARSSYIKQAWISQVWNGLTGAPIVDIRKIRRLDQVAKYVMKYLCKQTYIPWTNRRVSWSRHFFPKKEPFKKGFWKLHAKHWMDEHPDTVISSDFLGSVCTKVAADVWLMDKPGRDPSTEKQKKDPAQEAPLFDGPGDGPYL